MTSLCFNSSGMVAAWTGVERWKPRVSKCSRIHGVRPGLTAAKGGPLAVSGASDGNGVNATAAAIVINGLFDVGFEFFVSAKIFRRKGGSSELKREFRGKTSKIWFTSCNSQRREALTGHLTARTTPCVVEMALKRKSSKAGPSKQAEPISDKRFRAAPAVQHEISDEEDGSDDFDDGQDLLAAATSSGRAGIAAEILSGDESGEELDRFDPEPQYAGMDDYEEDADEDGFEILDEEDPDDVQGGGVRGQIDGAGSAHKSKAQKSQALYALPTNEEMQGLRETGELFKTNILKLQVS